MPTRKKALTFSLVISGLTFFFAGCNPQLQTREAGSKEVITRASIEIKTGVTLPYEPKNGDELNNLRTDLILLIKQKKITVDEARAFFREQKNRLGLPYPDKTRGFDRLLKKEKLM